MIKKTVTCKDFNGVERTNDYYFHLSEAELMEMELSTEGGYAEMLTRISKAQDSAELIKAIKDLVLRAYGEKSPDGTYFDKSPEAKKRFEYSPAFSEIFMKLATDTPAAIEFAKGIMPDSVDTAKADAAIAAKLEELGQK